MAEPLPTPRYTIDASAMAKWWLNDEDLVDQARAFRAEVLGRRVSLFAPTQLHYEVVNLLRRSVRANRISRVAAQEAIAELLALPIQYTQAPDILQDALDLSLRLNLSFYDACYLLIAELSDGTLISDDRNMRRALGGSHARVVWLADYAP